MKMLCSIPNCDKPRRARGWCEAHYRRWRRGGDPHGDKPLRASPGEPLRFFHEVILPYDGDECLIWPYADNGDGYGVVLADGEMGLVSRLVCERRYGPPPTPEHEAAHSCGRGHERCVTRRHVRWSTRAQNAADKLIHGTHGWKLTEDDVREIRRLDGTTTPTEIGKIYEVSATHISRIMRGAAWAHVTVEPSP